MQERTMVTIKEKLEKKFYRTKSETVRLNELAQDITILKSGKNLLLHEFKEKLNQYKNHPFNDKGYNDILNSLKKDNDDLKSEKQAYKKNLKVVRLDIGKRQNDLISQEETINTKKVQLSEAYKKIDLETYDYDQLRWKLNQLSTDIATVNQRLHKYTEIEEFETIVVNRLLKHKHSSEIKKVSLKVTKYEYVKKSAKRS